MTQEVRVMLQLTLEVDAVLSREQIQEDVEKRLCIDSITAPINVMMVDIIEIREEAEIYGND